MIVNIVKLLIVASLITFLVVRYRTRSDTAVSPEFRVAESTAAPAAAKSEKTKAPRLRRRDRSEDTSENSMGRQTRLRPRMMAKMPDPVDSESMPDTQDPPLTSQITGAAQMPSLDLEPMETTVDVVGTADDVVADSITEAIDLRPPYETDGVDTPISTPGWPAPNEFVRGGTTDQFTADAAGPAESLEPPAMDESAAVDETAELPQLRAAAGWASVDASEVGLDDTLTDQASTQDPPPPPDWQNDDDFDPASGWANPDGAATWTPAEPDSSSAADQLMEAAAWSPETPDSWQTAPDPQWQPDEVEPAKAPEEAPAPTWDVSDWTTPIEESITDPNEFEVQQPEAPVSDASAISDGLPVMDQSTVESQDAAPTQTPAEADEPVAAFEVIDPAETEPAFESGPTAAVEWGMPVTETDESWPADSEDGTTRNIIPVSADPNAPVIMYLEAGDEEMKVVIERDQLGNPIAWVLSGAAKVDAEGSAIRVRIPNADDPEEAAIRDAVDRAADLPVAELKDRLARAEIALAEIASRLGGTSDDGAAEPADAEVSDAAADEPHGVETSDDVPDDSGDGAEAAVSAVGSVEPAVASDEQTEADEQFAAQADTAADEPDAQPFAGVELDLDAADTVATDEAEEPESLDDDDTNAVVDVGEVAEDSDPAPYVADRIDEVEPDDLPDLVGGEQQPAPTPVPKLGELSRKEARRRAMEGASAHAALDAASVEKAEEPTPKAKPKKPRSTTKRTRAASGVVARAEVVDAPVEDSPATDSPASAKPSRRKRDDAPREVEVVAESLSAGDGYGHAMDIALMVQEEANRRFAQVLAQHGSVKANGDFWGLVDRLEHVADTPAVNDEA